ncbi:MAG: 3-phosphoshikimate 1-carboxyvinyltransferase [Candidatus Obscuribacterales bacterium]|nr:3-phosphoshikimate 1-carboxyvinyltransferase [Candidatus Obscuribacterales bacterium]
MTRLKGRLQVPGDKSISHRALIFAALSKGKTQISGLSSAVDCLSTVACLKTVGLDIDVKGSADICINAKGLESLVSPSAVLDAANSGTTMRLLSGLMAGSKFSCCFDGDASLRRRPMGRLLDPLRAMGATVEYENVEGGALFRLIGGNLVGKEFHLDVASAQLQTALLLAGLQASGKTTIVLPGLVRDHTTRLFKHIGVPLEQTAANTAAVTKLSAPISPFVLKIPGDISSAAFFMVAAACLPGSEIVLTNLGLNPGRCLIIDVLQEMGAHIEILSRREEGGEPVGDVLVRYNGLLSGATIDGKRLASGVDEIPVLSLAGALCGGTFLVRDAAELKVKESDRLASLITNLSQAGVAIVQEGDGFKINGANKIKGGSFWKSNGDHRMAMTGIIADLLSQEEIAVDDRECIVVSYPSFLADLSALSLG